eukprot:scaffold277766_cov18-Tisochrysis_lutea.AAC.1
MRTQSTNHAHEQDSTHPLLVAWTGKVSNSSYLLVGEWARHGVQQAPHVMLAELKHQEDTALFGHGVETGLKRALLVTGSGAEQTGRTPGCKSSRKAVPINTTTRCGPAIRPAIYDHLQQPHKQPKLAKYKGKLHEQTNIHRGPPIRLAACDHLQQSHNVRMTSLLQSVDVHWLKWSMRSSKKAVEPAPSLIWTSKMMASLKFRRCKDTRDIHAKRHH